MTPDTIDHVALVTGAGKRIGRAVIRGLHAKGMRIAIHYNESEKEALGLKTALNEIRPNSAKTFQANLLEFEAIRSLCTKVLEEFSRVDVLVNNASIFKPTPLSETSDDELELFNAIHIRAPFLLIQSLASALQETQGCIINITDFYASQPLMNHVLYCTTKSALEALTKSCALDLAPDVRVNAIAPGAILWPDSNKVNQIDIIRNTPLKRIGSTDDVVNAVVYLVFFANFTTGAILRVDGGRTL